MSPAPSGSRRIAPPRTRRANPLFGDMLRFAGDLPALAQEFPLEYGPIVQIRTGVAPLRVYLLTDPEYIEHVLLTNHRNYVKDRLQIGLLQKGVGANIFTTNGDEWLRLRQIMRPVFDRREINQGYAQAVTDETAVSVSRLIATEGNSEPTDLEEEIRLLTCRVVLRSMIRDISDASIEKIRSGFDQIFDHLFVVRPKRLFLPPLCIPSPNNRRTKTALATVAETLDEVIQARRSNSNAPHDFLGLMLSVADKKNDATLTNEEIVAEVSNFMFNALEPIPSVLTLVFHLLATHPDAEQRLHAELDEVLGDHTATIDDLDNLDFTKRLIRETMRLYSPALMLMRVAKSRDKIGPYQIPAKARAVINICGMHYHPDYWDNPRQFDPDRFSNDRFTQRSQSAYMPFGVGARACSGEAMVMAQMQLIVATLANQLQFRPPPGPQPVFSHVRSLAYRPEGGLPMNVHRRVGDRPRDGLAQPTGTKR